MLACGAVGRPRLHITQDQLEHLLSLGFSGPSIADVLGVSLSTVRRRMNDYGLSIRSLYSAVTDQDLDRIVSGIKANCGYRLLKEIKGIELPRYEFKNRYIEWTQKESQFVGVLLFTAASTQFGHHYLCGTLTVIIN